MLLKGLAITLLSVQQFVSAQNAVSSKASPQNAKTLNVKLMIHRRPS